MHISKSSNSIADVPGEAKGDGRPAKLLRVSVKKPLIRPPTLTNAPEPHITDPEFEAKLTADGRIFEYEKAANPPVAPMPIQALEASVHLTGPTRVIPFDLSGQLNTPYPCSSPNLLVGFLRIVAGESLDTVAMATSQAFYVLCGAGSSTSVEHGAIPWAAGDMVVLPATPGPVTHQARADVGDASLYWVSDEPLLKYLGVAPVSALVSPTVVRREAMLAAVEAISHEPGVEHRNRMGILLGNKVTDPPTAPRNGTEGTEGTEEASTEGRPSPSAGADGAQGGASQARGGGSGTLTLTPTLWSLLNVLPAQSSQRPHRHQSVALDLCIYAQRPGGVYTMMGPELDPATGLVKDGIRMDWASGSVFSTPPGWWHSHHNETGEPAWVLPMQDAGLLTYQRALDIRFSPAPPASQPEAPPPGPSAAAADS